MPAVRLGELVRGPGESQLSWTAGAFAINWYRASVKAVEEPGNPSEKRFGITVFKIWLDRLYQCRKVDHMNQLISKSQYEADELCDFARWPNKSSPSNSNLQVRPIRLVYPRSANRVGIKLKSTLEESKNVDLLGPCHRCIWTQSWRAWKDGTFLDHEGPGYAGDPRLMLCKTKRIK